MSKSFKRFMHDHAAVKARNLIEQREEKKLEKRLRKENEVVEIEEVTDVELDEETRRKYLSQN